MNKLDIASEYMKNGYNCAQSIIKAYANEVGMEEADDTANKDSALIQNWNKKYNRGYSYINRIKKAPQSGALFGN